MDTTTKVLIGVGTGAAILFAVGFYQHYKNSPAALPPLTGNVTQTLTPGEMQYVQLSYGAGNTYTFSLPTGASWGTTASALSSNNPSVINVDAVAQGSTATLKPQAQGQARLLFNWVDASGKAQTSNVLITVQS